MGKKIVVTISIILIILVSLLLLFIFGKDADDSDVKIKDNVKIITVETESEYHPISVTEDTISFKNDPKYEVGDIIVSGIIDSAPNGFIRRVISVSKTNGIYEYKTEYAVLTDVFEEAHIVKTFAVTNEEVKDMAESNDGVKLQNLSTNSIDNQEESTVKVKPSENGIGIVVDIEDKIGKCLEIDCEVEVATYFELKIDIEDGEVDLGMAVHTDTEGELLVGYKGELFDKDDEDQFNGEYEKEIISKSLPSIQFLIGPVPVVITNDFELSAEISAQLEGQIGLSVGLDSQRVSGFEYSSKTGKIVEINENNYLSDGMQWKTEAKAEGEVEAGIYAHLITKLYGSTGTDLAIGIAGEVEGELGLGVDEKLTPTLFGKLYLYIGPKASGKIVVTVPVVDYDLVEAEIFKVTLPAFWEKEWEIPDSMLRAMQKGDFSCFAGRYIATPEVNKAYGSGQKLNPLVLEKDGSVIGGGTYYSEIPFSTTPPISVEKQEDGSYKCVWEEVIIYDPAFPDEPGTTHESYYVIYPAGVIEDSEYVRENQAYLKDVVYIRCIKVGGGVFAADYYSDSIENVVVDYQGDDWVSIETKTEDIGESFISGTGVQYTVIATQEHIESGRVRVVLQSEDGELWMIPNLPAFLNDERTGILYYNIYEYVENEEYIERPTKI